MFNVKVSQLLPANSPAVVLPAAHAADALMPPAHIAAADSAEYWK